MVTTSQIATCILLPCKRKAPLLYLPASPKQILNRRDLKRRSSPPCVRLGSPPGLNLFLQPARSSGLFCCPRSTRETTLGFRAQPWPAFARATFTTVPPRASPRQPAPCPSALARARPSPSAPPPRHPAHALSPFPFGFHTARNLPFQEPIMDGT